MTSEYQTTGEPVATEGQRPEPRTRWEGQRRERTLGDNGVVIGLVLVALGVVFLLRNSGLFYLENWWALFILIPAGGALANAWQAYQSAGNRLTPAARGSLVGGLVLVAVSLIFLLSLNWGLVWPVLLIIAGGGLLLGGRVGHSG